jgi:hypothetical protein
MFRRDRRVSAADLELATRATVVAVGMSQLVGLTVAQVACVSKAVDDSANCWRVGMQRSAQSCRGVVDGGSVRGVGRRSRSSGTGAKNDWKMRGRPKGDLSIARAFGIEVVVDFLDSDLHHLITR